MQRRNIISQSLKLWLCMLQTVVQWITNQCCEIYLWCVVLKEVLFETFSFWMYQWVQYVCTDALTVKSWTAKNISRTIGLTNNADSDIITINPSGRGKTSFFFFFVKLFWISDCGSLWTTPQVQWLVQSWCDVNIQFTDITDTHQSLLYLLTCQCRSWRQTLANNRPVYWYISYMCYDFKM